MSLVGLVLVEAGVIKFVRPRNKIDSSAEQVRVRMCAECLALYPLSNFSRCVQPDFHLLFSIFECDLGILFLDEHSVQ